VDRSIAVLKDIAVKLAHDRPGELAKAVTAIANMQVNIEGYCEVEGTLHCVTSDPKSARKGLETVGFEPTESDIIVFAAEDQPGFLANVLRKLADEEVNLIASYTLTNTRIGISVDQTARAKEVLEELAPAATQRR
jgi:hypothetical protein